MLFSRFIWNVKKQTYHLSNKMKKYYISAPGGSPEGPFDEETIKKGIEDGTYKSDSLVFSEGMADWEPVSKHIVVAAPASPVPPVPPAPAVPPVPPAPQAGISAAGNTGYSFGQSISSCFKRYAKFDGRACQSEYWWFFLFTFIVGFIPVIGLLASLACIVPSIAVAWRRMHDIGKPGWFALIPIYGLILCAQPSVGPNQFGNAPDAPAN